MGVISLSALGLQIDQTWLEEIISGDQDRQHYLDESSKKARPISGGFLANRKDASAATASLREELALHAEGSRVSIRCVRCRAGPFDPIEARPDA